jgi:hypothetical protein
VEETSVDEALPESTAEAAPETVLEEVPRPAAPAPNWLRLAYSVEFLLALMAILTLWSEVGGQGHLDMMPWYTKLICMLASAWCCVRFTASIVERPRAWNGRALAWLGGIITMSILMGGITYYYHLQEGSDQQDSDETTTAATNWLAPRAQSFDR